MDAMFLDAQSTLVIYVSFREPEERLEHASARVAGVMQAKPSDADETHATQTCSRVMAWSTAWLTGGSTALPRKPAMLPGSSAGSRSFT